MGVKLFAALNLSPPVSGSLVNDSTFVLDVNVPDGTHFAPSTTAIGGAGWYTFWGETTCSDSGSLAL
jgi:hypothetical protein